MGSIRQRGFSAGIGRIRNRSPRFPPARGRDRLLQSIPSSSAVSYPPLPRDLMSTTFAAPQPQGCFWFVGLGSSYRPRTRRSLPVRSHAAVPITNYLSTSYPLPMPSARGSIAPIVTRPRNAMLFSLSLQTLHRHHGMGPRQVWFETW